MNKGIKVNTKTIENAMDYSGETVLSYKIEYPEFVSLYYQKPLAIINKLYRNKALAYQRYCRTVLYKAAAEQYRYDTANGYPVRTYEAQMVYELTYGRACIISLYFDQYEYTGGAHGNTVRSSQTFNLQGYRMLKLGDLLRCRGYKAYIIQEIDGQIKKEPEIYFEDYEKLIVENFNENSFYCTPEGIVIYYQQYDIAPYASGIREFLIPYSDCVLDPVVTCVNNY